MNQRYGFFRHVRLLLAFAPLVALGSPARAEGPRHYEPKVNIPYVPAGVRYGDVTGGRPMTPTLLFGKDGRPSGLQVKQGLSGTCYLDAAAAVYAQFHPKVIERAFVAKDGKVRTNANGTQAVRFFVGGAEGRSKPRLELTPYTGRVPLGRDGKPVLNRIVDDALWSPTLEIAYTTFRNGQGGAARVGLARTGMGGKARYVMHALTGKDAVRVAFEPTSDDETWELLVKAQANDDVVTATTAKPADLEGRIEARIQKGLLDGRARRSTFDADRWIGDHAHSLWGSKSEPFLIEKDGQRYVRVRNPWGNHAPGGVGVDGIGVVPFREFMLRFDRIHIGASSIVDDE